MEFLEPFEENLIVFIAILKLVLEAIAAVCILIGLVQVLKIALLRKRRRQRQHPYIDARIRFGMWLALALEFQLGSDILTTTISPSLEALARLAAIAIIRTFLNYFLSKELEGFYQMTEKTSPQTDSPILPLTEVNDRD